VTDPGRGQLYVVSTPIGNMGDFSFRGVEILRSVALILAEDTRHSRHLLDRYEIDTPTRPFHEHNEARSIPAVLARLEQGEDVALVSDAGTPLISDPGSRLVTAIVAAGFDVTPVPGASALLAALVASGLSGDRFTFFGFLPRKGRDRQAAVAEIEALQHTAVLYESPQRLATTLEELCRSGLGERQGSVSRELTKKFEETRRGTLEELSAYYGGSAARGEVVLVIAGRTPVVPSEMDAEVRARELAGAGLSVRDITAQLAEELGVSRNVAYRVARQVDAASKSSTDDGNA
jgi:16S rRNA (cytidine1402-2'-O)-methyltransferase